MSLSVGELGETDAPCPSCGEPGMRAFLEQLGVPSHSVLLLDSAEEARTFPRGDIRLAFCEACGFISNTAVDEGLQAYSGACEETQAFSPRFQAFAHELASDLVERHALRGRSVLEIGCGKGEFLSTLCRLGGNRGIGIDPAVVPERVPDAAPGSVEVIQDYYSERYEEIWGELLVCRHTLEHIPRTGDFVDLLGRSAAGRRADVIVFELPDIVRVLREGAFWDVYYEHCSYFSPGSLARLFRLHGLEPTRLWLEFDDQYVMLEAAAGEPGPPLPAEESAAELGELVLEFVERVASVLERWRARLELARERGERVALWGSGSKAVSFLGALGEVASAVEAVVDVNPHRHGRFLPGSGRQVLDPERLREVSPDLVVAMNPVYREEITAQLAGLGLRPELETL